MCKRNRFFFFREAEVRFAALNLLLRCRMESRDWSDTAKRTHNAGLTVSLPPKHSVLPTRISLHYKKEYPFFCTWLYTISAFLSINLTHRNWQFTILYGRKKRKKKKKKNWQKKSLIFFAIMGFYLLIKQVWKHPRKTILKTRENSFSSYVYKNKKLLGSSATNWELQPKIESDFPLTQQQSRPTRHIQVTNRTSHFCDQRWGALVPGHHVSQATAGRRRHRLCFPRRGDGGRWRKNAARRRAEQGGERKVAAAPRGAKTARRGGDTLP